MTIFLGDPEPDRISLRHQATGPQKLPTYGLKERTSRLLFGPDDLEGIQVAIYLFFFS